METGPTDNQISKLPSGPLKKSRNIDGGILNDNKKQ
jgi:hypothetical protein